MTAPLAGRRPARNVRLRVAQDTNRAERIRQLKTAHPELTWSYIAGKIGVRERSAVAWQKTGGISAKNAEKLAEVFGVSVDFLWFGQEKGPTPDLLAGVAGLEHVEAVRDEFRGKVDQIVEQLTEMEIERIQAAIRQQTELLADLTEVVAQLPALREIARTIEALRAADAVDRRGRPVLPAAQPDPPDEADGSQKVG
jgi:transcriptional regulator with XRE-family HTH domain